VLNILNKKKPIVLVDEDIAWLQSSLATLISPTLFVDEKHKLIEEIKERYSNLDKESRYTIESWLNGRYKTFLEKLLRYDKNIHNVVDFINYAFRWGVAGAIAQDVDYAYYLLEPIIKREKFKDEQISSYAFLTYGSVLFHYFKDASLSNREYLFFETKKSLLSSYSLAKNEYLKNRSAYFLTQLHSIWEDFSTAIIWYFKSLDCSDLVHDQFSMSFSLLFRDIDSDMVLSFNNLKSIFTKERVKNRYFWHFVKGKLSNSLAINHIDRFVSMLSIEDEKKIDSWGEDVENFFNTLNEYINLVVEPLSSHDSSKLQSLYFSSVLNSRGKAKVLFRMAQIQRFYTHDLSRAMLMVSESNGLFFDSDRLDFMSSILLEDFEFEIREILNSSNKRFKNSSIDFYLNERDRKVVAWKRLVKEGVLSGRFDEEIEFLEYINDNTQNSLLQQVLMSRLAYLYFKGTAGISEDGYMQPDYKKAYRYFGRLKESNPLADKYLQHPKLSIYLDIEKPSPIGESGYLLFEKRMSSKLLIVFSCAYSYMHYTQLREFYQKNRLNVLFISNPSFNWYHQDEWDRVESIMKEVVFKRFKKENITTYFGSMGGYMALRVALTYGLKAVVFNPQIDLNIWIKHRPVIATRLKPYELVHIQEFPISSFERTPIYIMSSSSVEDVEVFKLLVEKFSMCKKGLFIIEKIPDSLHAGIFAKVYAGNQQSSIINISNLLDRYSLDKKHEKIPYKIPKEMTQKFWQYINSSMRLRVIIQIDGGDIYSAGVKDSFVTKPTLYSLEDEIDR